MQFFDKEFNSLLEAPTDQSALRSFLMRYLLFSVFCYRRNKRLNRIMEKLALAPVKDIIGCLKSKNPVKENLIQITSDHEEMFKVRVESPEVLVIGLNKGGNIKVRLNRSASAYRLAHMEGVLTHLNTSGNKKFSRSYRSDKGGYEVTLSADKDDVLVITLTAHHFCSAFIGQGSTEMDITVTYC